MMQAKVKPYGSWKSPITADLIVAESIRLGEILVDGEDIYWLEGRPTEGGRYVIVQRTPTGTLTDITPPPFNARTRVHEYGGGSFTVYDGTVYFSNYVDQRLYRVRAGESPKSITTEATSPNASLLRYADGVIDAAHGRIICVREDHRGDEVINTIASIDVRLSPDLDAPHLEEGAQHVLVSGNDFYATPRLSPDGAHLSWITWNHPNMPWDGTELWIADVQPDGSLANMRHIAGGVDESIFQPEWSPDNTLSFISDRTGWWRPYRWQTGQVEALLEEDVQPRAEFGLPQWVFRMSTYAFASANQISFSYKQDGISYLASLDIRTRTLSPIETPYTDIDYLQSGPGFVVFQGASATEPNAIVKLDLNTGKHEVLKRSTGLNIDPGYISTPQTVEFPTENGLTAYGFFYPPQNQDYVAPEGEKPPLIVISHGGPTGTVSNAFSLGIQYWTSRGFALLSVNYGGSTGYGRAYRERLKDQWGIVDVDDCANGARYLVQEGLVDGERLAIRGGSAGGYTTLSALTFRDVFKAGASHFGVSDLEALAKETHKFESRYLDRLIGPYPEQRATYVERSPIHHVEQLSCPIVFFQGLEDKVVPPNQAETMVVALRQKGIPVAYVAFEGEQHGFRRAENIKRALEGELYFYSQIFDFELAEAVDPILIENLG